MIQTYSSPRPVRKGIRKPAPITGYLAGAVGTAAIFGAPQAEAAVTAVTFDPAEFVTANGTGWVNVAVGNHGFLASSYVSGTYGGGTLFLSFTYQQSQQAKFFSNGARIGDGSANTALGTAYFTGGGYFADPQVVTFTQDQLNKNIGYQTNAGNWGWANVSYYAATKVLTINGAFVESEAGTPITINESLLSPAPEPSRALLALAGLGGVALRRRRKQAA